MLIVTTGIVDVISAHCYGAFTSLLPPYSPKLGLRYLKTKVHGAILNLVTRPRACVRERLWGFGDALRASRRQS
jgi:hypothetical protein